MQKYLSIDRSGEASLMDGHVPNEPESDLCKYCLPSSHDIQTFYRMHIVTRIPTGRHTPWPNRARMGVRMFKKIILALVDTAPKNMDQTILAHITLACLMRKATTVRNAQVILSGKTPMKLAMGRRPRDLLDPASMNPEQFTSTPTRQDVLIEEIQKLVVKTHHEVQLRKTSAEILLNE